MIDKTGISTGKEIRGLLETLENNLIKNYHNFFLTSKKNPLIAEVDIRTWQKEQLKKYPDYRKETAAIIKSFITPARKVIQADLEESYGYGIESIRNVGKRHHRDTQGNKGDVPNFNKSKKTTGLTKEVSSKLGEAFGNAQRQVEKQFLATVSGVKRTSKAAQTLNQAIDIAGASFLGTGVSAGLTKDGKNMNLVSKLESDTKEWSQESMFIAQGEASGQAGSPYVYITVHASSCPLCTPWQGRVLIDDVYQDGKPDGKHELLSTAIAAGLFHYNCRHNKLMFYPGIDKVPPKPDYVPPKTAEQHALYEREQKQRYMERHIRAWKRREMGAVSEAERRRAAYKVREWQGRRLALVREGPGLYRPHYWREKPSFKMDPDGRWRNLKYDMEIFVKTPTR